MIPGTRLLNRVKLSTAAKLKLVAFDPHNDVDGHSGLSG